VSAGSGSPIRLLASVTGAGEAALAAGAGADLIDAKDPASGALGALSVAEVRAIRRAVPPATPVSATIGDMVPDPAAWGAAAGEMAAAGVDYVKIGLFPGGDARAAIAAMARCDLGRARLVGVLLVDRAPDLALVEEMARAGFAGAMLDTADKAHGALPDRMPIREIAAFVTETRRLGLLCGLAGALRERHVAPLSALRPDYLGFRGALCAQGVRTGPLDPECVRRLRVALRAHGDGPAGTIGDGGTALETQIL
jgi:uncharacterized protein (UPF0264 family)